MVVVFPPFAGRQYQITSAAAVPSRPSPLKSSLIPAREDAMYEKAELTLYPNPVLRQTCP